jgi:hypothetical protein
MGVIEIVRVIIFILSVCLVLLVACAKSKVEIYPERPAPTRPSAEAPPVKSTDIPAPAPPPSKPSTGQPPVKLAPVEPPRISPPVKSYSEAVSKWKSYQDLVWWMEKEFVFDAERFKKYEGTLPPPRTPEETFRLRSGIYFDAAVFVKATLNRINPSYQAKITILVIRPNAANHYFCAFQDAGNIFVMDYGTPYKEIIGTHGPYKSLAEVKGVYEKYFPVKGRIEAISYLP